jgi:histidyl-tRNA synthetase
MSGFKTVKGFRDFFPEDCALRNSIFKRWRSVASRHGFVEYEGPTLESTDLLKKKSGDEITQQLFCFTTKGEEEVSMRPEVTPTLARMAAARQRDFPKPLKWFQIGPCYRYERQQRGRLREFYQFNVDILGEASPAADAELVALAIESLRSFALEPGDFIIRLSDRRLWTEFQATYQLNETQSGEFLQIIDKMERTPAEVTNTKLEALGMSLEKVQAFISSISADHPIFAELRENLEARDLWQYVKIDPGIVRGLAYYTGTVFEAFDVKHGLRAIAGGGRYDNLVGHLSDGAVQMSACGFAMGDVVLGELIKATPEAQEQMKRDMDQSVAVDVYVLLADETRRRECLQTVTQLRTAGWRVDYSLTPQKVNKQFQAAENSKARFAAIIGGEYPTVVLKNLATRDQMEVPAANLAEKIGEQMSNPVYNHLLA